MQSLNPVPPHRSYQRHVRVSLRTFPNDIAMLRTVNLQNSPSYDGWWWWYVSVIISLLVMPWWRPPRALVYSVRSVRNECGRVLPRRLPPIVQWDQTVFVSVSGPKRHFQPVVVHLWRSYHCCDHHRYYYGHWHCDTQFRHDRTPICVSEWFVLDVNDIVVYCIDARLRQYKRNVSSSPWLGWPWRS